MKRHGLHIGLMMMVIGWLLLTPLALWAQQPQSGGTLRVAWEADITGLDPYISPGVQSWYVSGNIFNSLLTIDSELNYVPDLATSWEILENGTVYVFHLRQGVKFHDGTDFDAEVVRWNYQRIMDPAEKTFVAPFFAIVDTVAAVYGPSQHPFPPRQTGYCVRRRAVCRLPPKLAGVMSLRSSRAQ